MLIALYGAISGCSARRLLVDNEGMVIPERSAVIFFVDGVDHTCFDNMLAAGDLPNIEKRFVHGGVTVKNGITSLPPTTYANSTTIITGLFPGHHGITGYRWFDRENLVYHDYGSACTYLDVNRDFSSPTIYDILDSNFTLNVQNHTRRGVDKSIDNQFLSGIDWFRQDFSNVDERVGKCVNRYLIPLALREKEWPTLTMMYFPGVDETGHRAGSDSPRYRRALKTADSAIGRIISEIQAEGLSDRTYYVLLTDHGHVPHDRQKTLDLYNWLNLLTGWRMTKKPKTYDDYADRLAWLSNYDAVYVDGSNRSVMIHFPGKDGWQHRPSPEVLRKRVENFLRPGGKTASLLSHPAIGAVCLRAEPGQACIFTAKGEITVERRVIEGGKFYRISQTREKDIQNMLEYLGYGKGTTAGELADGAWHSSRDWLNASSTAAYPDIVPQIIEMFDSANSGDMAVFANNDWAFSKEVKGDHGSAIRRDMHIILFFAGPDLPSGGSINAARLVDVMPTVLDLLDQNPSDNLKPDGVSIAPALLTAGK